ncbi:MAG: hypothetical protein Q7K44_02900, partial [Candidatus Liptonbacteria bacterium]|nr:hypothetical protein [Candidatus Liptonbacteria bacterium]
MNYVKPRQNPSLQKTAVNHPPPPPNFDRACLIITAASVAVIIVAATYASDYASAKTINMGSSGDILYFLDSVGIGTDAPSSTLTVAGAIRTTSVGVIFPDNTTQSTAYAGGTQTITAGNVSSGTFGSNTAYGNYTFGSPAILFIDNTNARVGIGTSTTPAYAL